MFLTSASVLAAQINLSNITTTNSVKTNDAILVNANLGGGVWATRTATKQAVFGDPFKVTSLLADNATNVAARINTSETWTGGNLVEAANNGTNVHSLHFNGNALVGAANSSAFLSTWGGNPADDGYFLTGFNDTTIGQPDLFGVFLGGGDPSGTSSYIELVGTGSGSATIRLAPNGSVKTLMSPAVSDGVTPYSFGSSVTHTSGNLMAVPNNGTNQFSVTFDGRIITQGGVASTPASAGATGTAGEIRWDASFIYVCVAANTWKRVAIATW